VASTDVAERQRSPRRSKWRGGGELLRPPPPLCVCVTPFVACGRRRKKGRKKGSLTDWRMKLNCLFSRALGSPIMVDKKVTV
jgi:hypothetical protein